MEKTYYYRVGEQQIGPVSLDQMRGAVSLDTYVWCEGMASWTQINQLPDVMFQLGLSADQPQPQPEAQAQPQPQYAQPSYQQPQPNTNSEIKNEPSGTKPAKPNNYLVLSIISILVSCIIGIVALVFSILSDSDYKKGDYKGAEEKAKIAKIVAIVGLVLGGLYWICNILYVLLVVGAGVLQSY
ncbi:MAG: CD225/dispanin family protein [Bacteroidales bacterium]|nr:CD225/dispanin family protein [Bacteroidales bacterium]